MALVVSTQDLALYLGVASVDDDRAELLLQLAGDLCSAIVTPLPDTAKAIVLSAAARGYANPQGVSQETTGPYQVTRPWAGVYLTRAERAALKRLAGSGGAFTINPIADGATDNYVDPLAWPTAADMEEFAQDEGYV